MSATAVHRQRVQALTIANAARLAGVKVKADLHAGVITLAEALEDPRAQHAQIGQLLSAQRAWGETKTNALLGSLYVFPTRRVRDLTARQKAEVVRRTTR